MVSSTIISSEMHHAQRIAEGIEFAEGARPFPLHRSTEEATELMKTLMGFGTIVSNVNLPNRGQMPQLPAGSIVETNCVFSNDLLKPVLSDPLPGGALELVARNCGNLDACYEGIRARDMGKLFEVFLNQPLCEKLTREQGERLFKEMCQNTREYLEPWFRLDF